MVNDWTSFAAGTAVGVAAGALAMRLYTTVQDGKRIEARTATGDRRAPARYAGACKLRPDMFEQYTRLHDHTWDEVMMRMYEANMRNFVVYLHEETMIMFHHFEYIGDDFESDMKMLDNDPTIQFWWTHCEPCQEPFHWEGPPPSQGGDGGKGGSWWAPMKCLNHCGGWPTAWSKSWPDPDFVPNNPKGRISGLTSLDGLIHNRATGGR